MSALEASVRTGPGELKVSFSAPSISDSTPQAIVCQGIAGPGETAVCLSVRGEAPELRFGTANPLTGEEAEGRDVLTDLLPLFYLRTPALELLAFKDGRACARIRGEVSHDVSLSARSLTVEAETGAVVRGALRISAEELRLEGALSAGVVQVCGIGESALVRPAPGAFLEAGALVGGSFMVQDQREAENGVRL